MGDDLGKWNGLGLENYNIWSSSTIRFIGSHWLTCNGRILDSVAPAIYFALPRVAASALMGIMAAFYFYVVLKASDVFCRNRITSALVVLVVLFCILPWGDGMWLLVCQANYMWSTAFCIYFWSLFCKEESAESLWSVVWGIVIGIATGFTHEQTGVSASVALVAYLMVGKRYATISRYQRALAVALFTGTFFAIASPAIWQRAESQGTIVTIFELLYSTLPVVVILYVVIIVLGLFERGRNRLAKLSRTSWLVFVIMALVSAVIALFSGVVGRTGWLPETCAVIALAKMLPIEKRIIKRSVAVTVSGACICMILLHLSTTVFLQKTLKEEYDGALKDYIESKDGVVFVNATFRPDFSIFALNHAQGIPDADDLHLLRTMASIYRTDSIEPVFLPLFFKDKLEGINDSLSDGTVTIYKGKPADLVTKLDETGIFEILVQQSSNGSKIVKSIRTSDGTSLWVAQPLIIDKGDHWVDLDAFN